MQHHDQQGLRPKRCATVPAGKTDPMGALVIYSVKAPAGEEDRMCLKELETAKPCDVRERALRSWARHVSPPRVPTH